MLCLSYVLSIECHAIYILLTRVVGVEISLVEERSNFLAQASQYSCIFHMHCFVASDKLILYEIPRKPEKIGAVKVTKAR